MHANHQHSDVYDRQNKGLFRKILESCIEGQVICPLVFIARDTHFVLNSETIILEVFFSKNAYK